MELTQTVTKSKEDTEIKAGVELNGAAKDAQSASLSGAQEDSAFVSASHEFAVKQYEVASTAEDGSVAMLKAEKVAESMGFSQSYEKNPFDADTQRELARAYEVGERQQERILEESRIGKDDKEMEYDN